MDASVETYRPSGVRMRRLLALSAGLCCSTGAALAAKPIAEAGDVLVGFGH